MKDDNLLAFMLDLLGTASENDITDELWWRTDGEYAPITFWVNCNDFFWWGTSDLEAVTPESLPVLRQAMLDATEAYAKDEPGSRGGGSIYGGSLYCCRMRKTRPQGACYKNWGPAVCAMFDACGPEREIDACNPKPNKGKEGR